MMNTKHIESVAESAPDPALQPWYRQFWPWFLIAIPAATVVACMYTIFLALTTSDSLVVSGGGGIDAATSRVLAAEQTADARAMRGEFSMDAETGIVMLRVENLPASKHSTALTLDFSHPAFAGRDHSIELYPAPSGDDALFVGQQPAAMDERWYLVLQQDEWRLSGVWEGRDSTTLLPRGAQ